MDRHYTYQGTDFIWNVAKARSNLNKHGISFESAATVFLDPFMRVEDASRRDSDRDAVIGYDMNNRLLYVVHVESESRSIRIISARKATQEEHHRYDQ